MKNHQILAQGPWDTFNVQITYSEYPAENRPYKDLINSLWQKYIQSHPLDFNAPLLQLCEWENKSKFLDLELSITDYATYVAEKEIAYFEKLLKLKKAEPLGMCLVILTSDKKYIVTRRSTLVSQSTRKGYLVGGYMEPIKDKDGDVVILNVEREIHEELNIASHNISLIKVLYLAYNNNHPHPELFIQVNLSITSSTVMTLWQNAEDMCETQNIYFLDPQEVNYSHIYRLFRGQLTASLRFVLKYFDFKKFTIKQI